MNHDYYKIELKAWFPVTAMVKSESLEGAVCKAEDGVLDYLLHFTVNDRHKCDYFLEYGFRTELVSTCKVETSADTDKSIGSSGDRNVLRPHEVDGNVFQMGPFGMVFYGKCRECDERILVNTPTSGFTVYCPRCGKTTYVGPRKSEREA
jgi:hypothetical protein